MRQKTQETSHSHEGKKKKKSPHHYNQITNLVIIPTQACYPNYFPLILFLVLVHVS